MTQFSNRITTLTGGGSDGWDIYRKSRRMIAAGQPVIELTIGEHDRKTDPAILEAMYRAALDGHTGYASIPGTDELRDRVASRTERITGVPTTRDNVVITAGGQAALFLAHALACDPGETALYVDPYYATYPGTIREAIGTKLTVTPLVTTGPESGTIDWDNLTYTFNFDMPVPGQTNPERLGSASVAVQDQVDACLGGRLHAVGVAAVRSDGHAEVVRCVAHDAQLVLRPAELVADHRELALRDLSR